MIVNKYAHLTGGADQHCLGLASALTRRGHEVRFISTADERNAVDEGIFVRCIVTHGSRESLSVRAQASVFAQALWNRDTARATQKLLDDFRPDVVHTHKLYPQLSAAPVVVAARAGVPVVQTLHDFEMISASPIDARGGRWDQDETRLRFKLLNVATRPMHRLVHVPRVSAFVAVSRFVARVHAAHGIDATVIANFVSYGDDDGREPLPYDARRGIVFLGRLRPEKGALDAVGVAARIDLPVTIVGSGDLEDEIHRRARTIPNLRVAGFVPDPDLREILRNARVVIIPSRCQDAGPLVPLESMANGTPVVAYAMGGLGEYVTDTGGGRVVPVDVPALASAAQEIHEDAGTWSSLSRSGYEAVTRHHTPSAYAGRIEAVYENAVRSAQRPR